MDDVKLTETTDRNLININHYYWDNSRGLLFLHLETKGKNKKKYIKKFLAGKIK